MKRIRIQATEWEKIFAKGVSERGLLLKIQQRTQNSTIRK